MKTKIIIAISSALIAITLNGCGAGGNTSQSSVVEVAPQGPFSYAMVTGEFESASASRVIKHHQVYANSVDSSCGSVYSEVGDNVGAATGFLNYIPVVGNALSVVGDLVSGILGMFGEEDENACFVNNVYRLNEQLAQQGRLINDIQNQLNLLSNEFYTSEYRNAEKFTTVQASLYNASLQAIIGSSNSLGSFGSFMVKVKLWRNSDQPSPIKLANLEQNVTPELMALLSIPDYISSQANFNANIKQFSGTSYNRDICEKSGGNCYTTVQMENGTLVTNLYSFLYDQAITQSSLYSESNTVNLFDNYNDVLSSIYLQSATGLQQAFTMEYMVNQMNYYAGKKKIKDMIPSISGTYGTFFEWNPSVNESVNLINYNLAQTQLALFYLAKLNQLYLNTAMYIITDAPIGGQRYPTEPVIIDTGGEVVSYTYDYKSFLGIKAKSPMQLLGLGLSSKNTESMALYQYAGITNTAKFLNAQSLYNDKGGKHEMKDLYAESLVEPVLMTQGGKAMSKGFFKADSVIPYYSKDKDSLPELGGQIYGVLGACKSRQDLNWYTPNDPLITAGEIGKHYAMCTSWKFQAKSFNDKAYVSGERANSFARYGWYGVWDDVVPYASNAWVFLSSSDQKNILPNDMYAVGYDNQRYFGYSSYNKIYPGNMANLPFNIPVEANSRPEGPRIIMGNMPTEYFASAERPYFGHQLAMQATMPDGFVLPYTLQFYNIYGEDGNYFNVACNENIRDVYYVNSSGEHILLSDCPGKFYYNDPQGKTGDYVNVIGVNNIVFGAYHTGVGTAYNNFGSSGVVDDHGFRPGIITWYYSFVPKSAYLNSWNQNDKAFNYWNRDGN